MSAQSASSSEMLRPATSGPPSSIVLQLHYRADGRVVLANDGFVHILALSEAIATNNSSPA
jgi:hypothetical protein